MLFEKVTKENVLHGIKDYETKGFPQGFGPSSTYDLVYESEKYPPKAIMAYANFHSEGRKIENYFKGGEGTDCFKAFKREGFSVIKKEKTIMNEELYKLKQDFLDYWPIDRLESMTLEEYTDTNRENSFCYWLEHITRDLGSIVGGSSYKFGIYKRSSLSEVKEESNRNTDGEYAWFKKYGLTATEAFNNIKKQIVDIAKYAQNNNLNIIDEIELGDAYKWKIAFLYSDYKVINIFKKEALNFVAKSLYNSEQLPLKYGDLNSFMLSKNEGEDYFNFTRKLWKHYDIYNSKAEEFKKWLKKYNEDGSNKSSSYLRAIKILTTEFNIEVYTENDIEILQDLYEDLILNQKDPNGKYAYHKKSYGEKGFYSAAIKTYIHFLKNELDTIASEEEIIYSETTEKKTAVVAKNQILYGPPGTGKTYFLKEHLFDKYTSKQSSITKEHHFDSVVSGCSWWQIIAIALLDLGNSKVSDIFEHKWVQKKASLSSSKTIRSTIWGQLQSHTIESCEFVNVSSRQQPLIFNKSEDSNWEILKEEVKELVPELYDLKDSVDNYNPNPDSVIKHYDFVTFHQSFAYEDFIEGIKPVFPENEDETNDLGYTIEDGVFKRLCIKAKNDSINRYAIFIDEINRGNVSAIFGELITLIETDKRSGAKNPMEITLPYSKKKFSVPSNLDIYGTMNTADRSVEALDTALRRRFEFKEMMPDYTVIKKENIAGLALSEVLETINKRIELLIDRDHTIGHSYFFEVDSEKKLANAFNNKIVPLLQEYFYGDYGKIGLVLGKGFVEKQKNDKIEFADFSYENANDFKTPSFILKNVDASTIVDAVSTLLGNKESNQTE